MRKHRDITLKELLLVGGGIIGLVFYGLHTDIPLISILLFMMLTAYLLTLSRKFEDKRYNFLSLGFLFLIGAAMAIFFKQATALSPYYIPVASVVMLVALLYRDLELALIFAVLLSFFVGSIFGGDLYLAGVLLLGSILGALYVWQARRRSRILTAGFFVGLIQSLAVLTFFQHTTLQNVPIAKFCTAPFLNGIISSFLVAGLLPVFEYLFRVVTNISLLELADFNHPLLKRLVFEAPGTYHHSLMVGNLAEVACESVGANALLARVGAYYHDIGKLEKPEYFSENQDKCSSKHDDLSASMSKLVIMEHVKAGVELARKNRLNNTIIEFIRQHHGTSLVYYFYRRALEAGTDEQGLTEEVFRYPGPKPQTKEAAIVLLADSAEAACRTLDEPTAGRISDMVHRVINNKFIDGQLDACDLTLRDLEKIATIFIHILGAFYHSRIDYPDKEKGDPATKKP
ncbi:MAG: HDIG domain-containing protein [Candidatus Omnitrophica bacterium]|nr:HDIG domain-containing protein [Candidatus Omnitrophota bacterium]